MWKLHRCLGVSLLLQSAGTYVSAPSKLCAINLNSKSVCFRLFVGLFACLFIVVVYSFPPPPPPRAPPDIKHNLCALAICLFVYCCCCLLSPRAPPDHKHNLCAIAFCLFVYCCCLPPQAPPDHKNILSASWGKLSCAILNQEWDTSLEELHKLRREIDEAVSEQHTVPGERDVVEWLN